MTIATAPAQGYLTVTADDLEILRVERVRALELDHARTVLLCKEVIGTADEAGPFQQLAEIDRRIHVHLPPEPKHAVDEEAPDAAAPAPTANEMITTDVHEGD